MNKDSWWFDEYRLEQLPRNRFKWKLQRRSDAQYIGYLEKLSPITWEASRYDGLYRKIVDSRKEGLRWLIHESCLGAALEFYEKQYASQKMSDEDIRRQEG